MTIKADFTCSFSFGIEPKFTDYHIEVPVNNNGHEPPILLARREPSVSASSPIDQFTVQVRNFFFLQNIKKKNLNWPFLHIFFQIPFAFFVAGAGYVVELDTTYAINGTNGSPVFIVGGVETGITINSS